MHSRSLRHLVPRDIINTRAWNSCTYDTMYRRWFLGNHHKLDIKKKLFDADFDKIKKLFGSFFFQGEGMR